MKPALLRLRDFAVDLVRRQPVRVATAIAAVVVVIFPGAIDQEQLTDILWKTIALLGIGESLRGAVFSPATVARMTRGARG